MFRIGDIGDLYYPLAALDLPKPAFRMGANDARRFEERRRHATHRNRIKGVAIVRAKRAPLASHRRIAFSSITSNTGARSPGEEL